MKKVFVKPEMRCHKLHADNVLVGSPGGSSSCKPICFEDDCPNYGCPNKDGCPEYF